MTELEFYKYVNSDECPEEERRAVIDAIKYFIAVHGFTPWKIRCVMFSEQVARDWGFTIPGGVEGPPVASTRNNKVWEYFTPLHYQARKELLEYGELNEDNIQAIRGKLRFVLEHTVAKLVESGREDKAGKIAAQIGRILLPANVHVKSERRVYRDLPDDRASLMELINGAKELVEVVRREGGGELVDSPDVEVLDDGLGKAVKKPEMKFLPRRPKGRPPKDLLKDMEKRVANAAGRGREE